MQKKHYVQDLIKKISSDKNSLFIHTGELKPGTFIVGKNNLNDTIFELRTVTRGATEKFEIYLRTLGLPARIVPPNMLAVEVTYPEFKENGNEVVMTGDEHKPFNVLNGVSAISNEREEKNQSIILKYANLFPKSVEALEDRKKFRFAVTQVIGGELKLFLSVPNRKGDYSMTRIAPFSKLIEISIHDQLEAELGLEDIYKLLCLFGKFEFQKDPSPRILFYFEKPETNNVPVARKIRSLNGELEAIKAFQKILSEDEMNNFNAFLSSVTQKILLAEKRGADEMQKKILPQIAERLSVKTFFETLEKNGMAIMKGYERVNFRELKNLFKEE